MLHVIDKVFDLVCKQFNVVGLCCISNPVQGAFYSQVVKEITDDQSGRRLWPVVVLGGARVVIDGQHELRHLVDRGEGECGQDHVHQEEVSS